MARFLVYNISMSGGGGTYKIVRWGSAPTSEFSSKLIDGYDVVVENIWGIEPWTSFEPGVIVSNWFNPTTHAFSVSSLADAIDSSATLEAVNFLAQSHGLDTTPDRLLRYIMDEGCFGLGSLLPQAITNFADTSPPTGFYYCDMSTVSGGPLTDGYMATVRVERGLGGVLFHVRRLSNAAHFMEWIGTRLSETGAVTWIESTPFSDLGGMPVAWVKQRVRLCSDSNIDVTTGGLGTIDGVTVGVNNRILLIGQTDPAENGIYLAASGSWTREPDLDETLDSGGAMVEVYRGSIYAGTQWANSFRGADTVGTSAMNWYQVMRTDTLKKMTAPDSFSAAATLTAANLNKIGLKCTGSTYNLTMPTASALNSGFVTPVDTGIEFSLFNGASGTVSLTVNTGVTIDSGSSGAVATGVTGRFALRKSGTSAWVLYRIS